MYPEDQGILALPKKPGPLERAANSIAAMPTAMQVPSGIAANAATNPTPTPAPATIADLPRPANQVQTPTGRTPTAAVEQPTPAALDPFAYRGGYPADAPKGPVNGPDSTALNPSAQGIAAPSQTGAMPGSPGVMQGTGHLNPNERISAAIGAVDQGSHGVGKPEVRQPVVTHGAADTAENAGIAAPPVGRNEQGVVTAESAAAAMGNPMTRSGGIAGSYDGKGVNDILARENAARGGMIDSMIKAQGGNGIAVLPDRTNDANEQFQAMKLSPAEYLAYQQAKGRQEALVNQGDAHNTIAMRGQELHAKTEAARLAGNPYSNALSAERIAGQQLSNEKAKRLGDLQQQLGGEFDPAKRAAIAGQIRELTGRADQAQQGETLTLPQVRSNFEIDAARKAVSGLTPEEIKRKTSNYTATGRENPDFDPTLAKAVSLSNRRKYGADDLFDQRQQAQQPAGNDGDVMTRFKSDQAMQGHKLGKQTDHGLEVLDASGRLIGHYH